MSNHRPSRPDGALTEPGWLEPRRWLSLALALALGLAMLPATTALASASGTAHLNDAILDTFPGSGQDVEVTVDNDESSLPVLGGEDIDWVRVILPASRGFTFSDADAVEQEGWDASTTADARSQTVTFTGGSISPDDSVTFDFLADVAAPADRDEDAPFQVLVSADGGSSAQEADGDLTSLVRILEILEDQTGVSSPAQARDSATYGQSVTYSTQVRNHATSSVPVTADLEPENAGHDVTARDGEQALAPGATGTFAFDVSLARGNQDTTEEFDVSATSSGAEASTVTTDLLLQAASELELERDTFQPRVANDETEESVRADFEQFGNPALDLQGGQIVFEIDGIDPIARALDPDASWDGDGTFETVRTDRAVNFGEGGFIEGDYDISYHLDVRDENAFEYTLEVTADDLLTLDFEAPEILDLLIELPQDEDGDQQTAVKDGDEVEISGSVEDDVADPDSLDIDLRGDGEVIDVTTTETADGFDFEATAEIDADGIDRSQLRVDVTAADEAGNTGTETIDQVVPIDNFVPELRVQAELIDDRAFDDQPVVRASFRDRGGSPDRVLGGCNPALYEVEGELLVDEVLYSDGTACEPGQPGPDDVRVITLRSERDRGSFEDASGSLRYEPSGLVLDRSDRIKDNAGNIALAATADIVDQIAPPLPEIDELTRNDGQETAVSERDDDGRLTVFTRFAGDDLEVTLDGDEIRRGDTLEARNGGGTSSRQAAADNERLSVNVPLPGGAADGDYRIELQLTGPNGVEGEIKTITVVLDTVAPVISEATGDVETGEVTVTFDQLLHDGRNAASDWLAFQDDDGDDAARGVQSVDRDGRVVTLEVAFDDEEFGDFAGVEYLAEHDDQYVDRAGNRVQAQFFSAR